MSLCVFCFHRVADVYDPLGLSVGVKDFEKFIKFLSTTNRVVTLNDGLSFIQSEVLHYSITFDDGYYDLVNSAIPILCKYEIPAAIFIPTYYTVNEIPFWWEVAIRLNSKTIKKVFNDAGLNSDQENDIIDLLKNMRFGKRERILSQFVHRKDALPKSLSLYQLKNMPTNIEICRHGHSHTLCSLLSREEFIFEIEKNDACLSELPNYNKLFFAYPNGTRDDYSFLHLGLLEEYNFHGAFTTLEGINTVNNNFELKRIVINSGNVKKYFNSTDYKEFISP